MNLKLSKSFLLLFCIFSLNASINKKCIQCSNDSTQPKNTVKPNELDKKVLEAIKAEFQKNKVAFEIPYKMSKEFEEKKQFIINNLNQKMMKLNTNQVTNDALNLLVQKTFDLFIKRIEYAQISKWMDDMLSNVKNKKQNATKSSSLNITDKNLLTKSQNPPFFKK